MVRLSKILDWFGDDFRQFAEADEVRDEKLAGVLNFVSRYLTPETAGLLETADYEVRFNDYDWTLNDQAIAAASR